MKIIFYIASTINGCIAKQDGSTPWSDEESLSFISKCREVRAAIMGRKTHDKYQTMDLKEWPLTDGPLVVLSSQSGLVSRYPETTFTKEGPAGAVKLLGDKGYKEVIVIGGNQTWTSFAKVGLVDEVFLDIEPLAFGDGKFLFSGGGVFDLKLKLLESRPLSSQTIQLHYLVQK